jgi:putative copper export protein
VSHFINFYRLATAPVVALRDAGLVAANAQTGPTVWGLGFQRTAGATGFVVCAVMCLMYSSAVDTVRRPSFESFWYTHHLFIIFYACLIGHGTLLSPLF